MVMGLSVELSCLDAIRDARVWFLKAVLAHAAEHRAAHPIEGSACLTREEIKHLRSDGVPQVAELLFTIDDLGLGDPQRLRSYLETHNEALETKLEDLAHKGQAYTDNGLSRERISDARLSDDQIQTLVDEAEDGRLRFDQTTFACLLMDAMAAESCRKLILLLSDCGFMRRMGHSTVRVRSTGVLERLYREHLAQIVTRVAVVQREVA
jgi:hypothetical protein